VNQPLHHPSKPDVTVRTRGLFDFQVNGYGGIDFQRRDISLRQMRHAVACLQRDGAAGIFLTLITDEEEQLCRQLERLEKIRGASRLVSRMIKGYHIEGPWLSNKPGFCGAHPAYKMVSPTIASFDRLQAAAQGQIRLVTIAPEWRNSPEVINHVTRKGVHVGLGHTDAATGDIDDAIKAGARFCTHLGNGVPLELPRHDNIIQRLLARDELTACFIPDGIHLPAFVLRNFVRTKTLARCLFTTDAMAGAGATPGYYTLGGLGAFAVGVSGIARERSGLLAGSTLTPVKGVALTAEFLELSMQQAHDLWHRQAAAYFAIDLESLRL
jgi:N-acetylglucosamine-6-phosphate deacetylase